MISGPYIAQITNGPYAEGMTANCTFQVVDPRKQWGTMTPNLKKGITVQIETKVLQLFFWFPYCIGLYFILYTYWKKVLIKLTLILILNYFMKCKYCNTIKWMEMGRVSLSYWCELRNIMPAEWLAEFSYKIHIYDVMLYQYVSTVVQKGLATA